MPVAARRARLRRVAALHFLVSDLVLQSGRQVLGQVSFAHSSRPDLASRQSGRAGSARRKTLPFETIGEPYPVPTSVRHRAFPLALHDSRIYYRAEEYLYCIGG